MNLFIDIMIIINFYKLTYSRDFYQFLLPNNVKVVKNFSILSFRGASFLWIQDEIEGF